MPAATTMGAVHLTVADLDRSLGYYGRAGRARASGARAAAPRSAPAGRSCSCLVEEPGARPAGGHTGLYHFALRVPERADLARWLAYAARDRVPLLGMSDHFVSEAIYLARPGRARHRDLPRPPARGLGGPGRGRA